MNYHLLGSGRYLIQGATLGSVIKNVPFLNCSTLTKAHGSVFLFKAHPGELRGIIDKDSSSLSLEKNAAFFHFFAYS